MDYCSQLWQAKMTFIRVLFRLKSEYFGTQHCLTKCGLENKPLNQNCWSWYHFSQEKLPHTLILVIASIYCGKYAVPFFMGHPVYYSGIRSWIHGKWPVDFPGIVNASNSRIWLLRECLIPRKSLLITRGLQK